MKTKTQKLRGISDTTSMILTCELFQVGFLELSSLLSLQAPLHKCVVSFSNNTKGQMDGIGLELMFSTNLIQRLLWLLPLLLAKINNVWSLNASRCAVKTKKEK